MLNKKIKIRRCGYDLYPRNNSLAVDAFNALSSAPGISNVELISDSDDLVELSFCAVDYLDVSQQRFLTHLIEFGLEKFE